MERGVRILSHRRLSANPSGRVLGKLGVAALRVGKLDEAAAAFARMGSEDPSRQDEAADGLELVARVGRAGRRHDRAAPRDRRPARCGARAGRSAGYVLALETRGALCAGRPAGADACRGRRGARRRHGRLAAAAVRGGASRRQRLRARLARLPGGGHAVDAEERAAAARTRGSRTVRYSIGKARLEAGAPADALAWLEEAIKADSASRERGGRARGNGNGAHGAGRYRRGNPGAGSGRAVQGGTPRQRGAAR